MITENTANGKPIRLTAGEIWSSKSTWRPGGYALSGTGYKIRKERVLSTSAMFLCTDLSKLTTETGFEPECAFEKDSKEMTCMCETPEKDEEK